jgi:bacteriocin biosynthesis cyclodehydratase domain-containing protein
MPMSLFRKPLLPSHYSVWFDPPDEAGDEALHIVSERRALKLKGHSFREFRTRVVPLLDGSHTLEQIQLATQDVFQPQDLIECIDLLSAQGVLVEAEGSGQPPDVQARMAPQVNFFHDLFPGANLQEKLTRADVAVIGLGGVGGAVALALGAAGVGVVRCVDSLPIAPSDIYFSPFLGHAHIGESRADSVAGVLRAGSPQTKALPDSPALESEDDIRRAIRGADFVLCCLDASQSNLVFKLNRVCLADGIRWITCSVAGAEITVGPGFHPGHSACYLCYRMRAVACTGNPEDAFAYEKYLDRRKQDDSGRRESLVFGAGIAAHLLGLETIKILTEFTEPSLVGRILTIRLTDLAIERHTVLRKPWCPACFPAAEAAHAD